MHKNYMDTHKYTPGGHLRITNNGEDVIDEASVEEEDPILRVDVEPRGKAA